MTLSILRQGTYYGENTLNDATGEYFTPEPIHYYFIDISQVDLKRDRVITRTPWTDDRIAYYVYQTERGPQLFIDTARCDESIKDCLNKTLRDEMGYLTRSLRSSCHWQAVWWHDTFPDPEQLLGDSDPDDIANRCQEGSCLLLTDPCWAVLASGKHDISIGISITARQHIPRVVIELDTIAT